MNDLKKKVFFRLFSTPWTLIPVVIGGSLLLLSEILGGVWAFVGFLGLLAGIGTFLTNITFNLEKIHREVLQQLQQKELRNQELELDALDRKLTRTEDDRDESALRNLRTLFRSFGQDLASGKLSQHVPAAMLHSVEEIFRTCISKLERSYEMYQTSTSMTGKIKTDLLKQRKAVIAEVEKSVLGLADVINEIRVLKFRSEGDELTQLQTRLSAQLEVARATEDGMAEIFGSRSVDDRLKEYE